MNPCADIMVALRPMNLPLIPPFEWNIIWPPPLTSDYDFVGVWQNMTDTIIRGVGIPAELFEIKQHGT